MQNSSISTRLALSLAATGVMASLYAAPAEAVNKFASSYQNMGGNCHAADPLDDISGGQGSGWFGTGAGMLRTPLSYRNMNDNNGTAADNIVIICNFAANGYAAFINNGAIRSVQFYARNTYTNRDVTMSCSITAGFATSTTNYTNTKSVLLTKDGVQGNIRWRASDNGGNYLPSPASISCSVPAGVELNDAEIVYEIDVGN